MARVVSTERLDLLNLDLSWYFANAVKSSFGKNANIQANGITYPDLLYVNGNDGTRNLELFVLGSGMSQDSTGRITTGTVNFFGGGSFETGIIVWYFEGISISAPAFYDALRTRFTFDELNLFVSALSGDDTIILSPFADRMSGFAGNDVITGGLGSDYLEGGGGDDTFLDTKEGLNGDRLADFGFGDKIIITDASMSDFTFTLTGSTLTYTGGSLTFGSTLYTPLVATAATGGGVQLSLVSQFAQPSGVLVSNFAVGAGGWSSQNSYPRHVADVNGDGYNDIVGFGQAGVLVSFGSANGNFSVAAQKVANFGQAQGWTSDNQFHRELADVNGDGRADIVGFGTAGTLVALAKADGTFGEAVVGISNFGTNQGWATQDGFARFTGDVNGDGKADIIGFGNAGTYVSLGNGDGTFKAATLVLADFGVQQAWTSDNLFHRTVADVNGDGFDDIIGFGFAGALVSLSKGDGTFGAATLAIGNFGRDQGWSSQDSFARAVADVNGDGKADIVGFGVAGTYVAYGLDNGAFTQARLDVTNFGTNQGWTSDNIYHRELADINNDGSIDIVGFGQAGVLASYNQGF